MQRRFTPYICIIIITLLLSACRQDEELPTLVPTKDVSLEGGSTAVPEVEIELSLTPTGSPANEPAPTPGPPQPTPLPPKEISAWMVGQLPETMYLYGQESREAVAVRHAVYENLFTSLGYEYQAQGLVKLPDLGDGDARIDSVAVQEGDLIVNATGNVVRLDSGVQIITADGEFVVFEPDGSETEAVRMVQMVVDFTFQPLIWSDGVPVTAVDSVFSYEVAADADTPGVKFTLERTASYVATADLRVRWTGLPGFLDPEYFLNVWTPLPEHQLGDLTAAELLQNEAVGRFPLSHGPFVISEWHDGGLILEQNPFYYRGDEGYPRIGRINLNYGLNEEEILNEIVAGNYHLLMNASIDQIPFLFAIEEDGLVDPIIGTTQIFEHIAFGIDSWEDYGDGKRNGRPDWFADSRVRQAMIQCLDRQGLIDEMLYGQSRVMPAYIPEIHPLLPADAQIWAADLSAGNALLDEVGLIDTDGDGIRELVEVDVNNTIVATTTMSITLGTDSESDFRLRLNNLITADLRECGILVNTYSVPANDWFADGPFSPLFGRRFDLATFAWRTNIRPPCGLYLTRNITGPEEQGFGGWLNVNATGWGDEGYDAACTAALDAQPGMPEYTQGHQEALRIFTQELPMIPLFPYIQLAVAAPQLDNIQLDPTQPSVMWNVYAWDLLED